MRSVTVSFVLVICLAICVSALTVKDSTINGQANKLVTWTDSKGKERKVGLRTDGPIGVSAYMTYYVGATKVTVSGSGNTDPANSGFGGYVHHGSGGASTGTLTQRFAGASMAIFDHKQTVDGTPETATYTFTDGNDYFQYAITDDCRAGTGGGDTRTPYCTIDWSGGQNLKAQGLEYGAAKYFKQPVISDLSGSGAWNAWSGPFTFSGTVDIPYAWEWAGGKEIGFVQSQTFTQQNAGTPTWSSGLPASGPHMATYWSTDQIGITDYQMNFYDNYSKITWGQPYGWMNATNSAGALAALKNKWGQYSMSIILDTKADSGVMRVRDENRAIHTAKVAFTATTGTVKDSGQVGTANPALQKLSPAGYDHNYRAWWVTAAGNDQASMNLTVAGTTPLIDPTFRVSGMTALPATISFNAATLTSGTGYYASYDATNKEVWLTIVGSFMGSNAIGVNMATPVLQRPIAMRDKSTFNAELHASGSMVIITFSAPVSGATRLCLYDQAGRLVANVFDGIASQGVNTVTWRSNSVGRNLRNGCLIAEYVFEGHRQAMQVYRAAY
jgi:hypothetical protein